MAGGYGMQTMQRGVSDLIGGIARYRDTRDYQQGLKMASAQDFDGVPRFEEADVAATPGGMRGMREGLALRAQGLELRAKEAAAEADTIMRTSAKAAAEASHYSDPMQQFDLVYKRDYSKINDGMDIVSGQFGEGGKFSVTYANKKVLDENGQPTQTVVDYDDFDKFKLHAMAYPTELARAKAAQAAQAETLRRSILFSDAASRRRTQLGLGPNDPLPEQDSAQLRQTFLNDPKFITDTVKTFNTNLENIDKIAKNLGWTEEQVKQYKSQYAIKEFGLTDKQAKVVSPGNMVPNKEGGGHSVVVEKPDGSFATQPVRGSENVTPDTGRDRLGEIKTPQGNGYSLAQLAQAYRQMHDLPSDLELSILASSSDPAMRERARAVEEKKRMIPSFEAFVEEVRTKGAPWDRDKSGGEQAPAGSAQPGPVQDALREIRQSQAPEGGQPQSPPASAPPAGGQPGIGADEYRRRWAQAQAKITDEAQLSQYRAALEAHAMQNGVNPTEF